MGRRARPNRADSASRPPRQPHLRGIGRLEQGGPIREGVEECGVDQVRRECAGRRPRRRTRSKSKWLRSLARAKPRALSALSNWLKPSSARRSNREKALPRFRERRWPTQAPWRGEPAIRRWLIVRRRSAEDNQMPRPKHTSRVHGHPREEGARPWRTFNTRSIPVHPDSAPRGD